VLDFVNREYRSFGRSGEGLLRTPANIRVGPDGNLYVADTERHQVVVFDPDGRYRGDYGDGKTLKPADVLVVGNELYVVDIAAHDVKVYDLASRALLRSIGERGKDPGKFNYPCAIVRGADGALYVCDSMNFRVQKVEPDGAPVMHLGQAGRTPGTLSRPRGLAVDRDGLIHVADARMGIVQIFNQEGRALMPYGGTGTAPGNLYLPAQVVIDYDNVDVFKEDLAPDFVPEYLIAVVNQFGPNSISLFAFGHREGFEDAPMPEMQGAKTPEVRETPADGTPAEAVSEEPAP
jgi:DNA-binding beta-propeller fold protein YncE